MMLQRSLPQTALPMDLSYDKTSHDTDWTAVWLWAVAFSFEPPNCTASCSWPCLMASLAVVSEVYFWWSFVSSTFGTFPSALRTREFRTLGGFNQGLWARCTCCGTKDSKHAGIERGGDSHQDLAIRDSTDQPRVLRGCKALQGDSHTRSSTAASAGVPTQGHTSSELTIAIRKTKCIHSCHLRCTRK